MTRWSSDVHTWFLIVILIGFVIVVPLFQERISGNIVALSGKGKMVGGVSTGAETGAAEEVPVAGVDRLQLTQKGLERFGLMSNLNSQQFELWNEHVKITFLEPVDLLFISSSLLGRNAELSRRYAYLETKALHGFGKQKARLTFYKINPAIPFTIMYYRDNREGKRIGQPCSPDRCYDISRDYKEWSVSFTVNEFSGYGVQSNSPPTIDWVDFNATSPNNYTSDNLTCTIGNPYDGDGDPVVADYHYVVDGSPYDGIFLSFDINISGASGNVVDFAGFESNGTTPSVQNSVPLWNDPSISIVGGSYTFDGVDDSLSVSHTQEFLIGKGSVVIWFNPTSTIDSTLPLNSYLFAKGTSSDNGGTGLYFKGGSGNLAFQLSNGVVLPAPEITSSASVFSPGWHMVAVVWDGLWASMYVDGVLQSGILGQISIPFSVIQPLVIGADASFSNGFSGTLDEFKIYHRALSSNQIQLMWNNGVGQFNQIAAGEGNTGEQWACAVTVTDGWNFNTTLLSPLLTLSNTPPTQGTPNLSSTSGFGYDTDDLVCQATNVFDGDADPVEHIFNYVVDGQSFTSLYLPFSGGSTSTATKDYGGFANDGVVSGNPVFNNTNGIIKGGYAFDGIDDIITVADAPSFDFANGQMSIELWAKLDALGSGNVQPLITRRTSSVNTIEALVDVSDQLVFSVSDGTQSAPLTYNLTSVIPAGTYHAYSFIVFGSLIEMYVDGMMVNTTTLSFTPALDISNPWEIGGRTATLEYFKGALDEIHISTWAITPNQVLANFNAGSGGYSTIEDDMTTVGESWVCSVTVNDGIQDGSTMSSSSLTIVDLPSNLGGGSGTGKNKTIYVVNFTETPELTLPVRTSDELKLYGWWKYWYQMTVVKVYLGKATLFLTPGVGTMQINDGETFVIDLNNDEVYDLVTGISNVAANISITAGTADLTLALYAKEPSAVPEQLSDESGTPPQGAVYVPKGGDQVVQPTFVQPAQEEPGIIEEMGINPLSVAGILLTMIIIGYLIFIWRLR